MLKLDLLVAAFIYYTNKMIICYKQLHFFCKENDFSGMNCSYLIKVAADRQKAFEYYLISAQKGNPETQYKVGNCYETGQGTKTDVEQALYWYQKAAAQGYPDAIDAIARMKQ